MAWLVDGLLDTSGFIGRWYCGDWSPLHGWLHIGADTAVFGAYAAIPVALVYVVRKRRDLPFMPVFWLFAAFILACGVGHLIDASIFWQPRYRLLTTVKVVTAIVSWLTVVALLRVLPKALEIQQSEHRFALAVRGSTDGVWDTDLITGETFFSERFCELLGYEPDELGAQTRAFADLVHEDDRANAESALQSSLQTRLPFDLEARMRTKAGETRWFRVRGQADQDATNHPTRVAGALTDITAEKVIALKIDSLNAELEERVEKRTAELSSMLREREVLVREMHHRVKNNLQVISSLINMQQRSMEGDAGRLALHACQARVQAMARVHELLYRADDASSIPLSEYVESLVSNIDDISERKPRVAIATAVDDVMLSVETAVPFGLILNELITNALKHAFPQEREGSIQVRVLRSMASNLTLEVCDDGVGLRTDFDPIQSASLGLTIVDRLASQLKGRLEVTRDPSTCFRVTFPAPDLTIRQGKSALNLARVSWPA